MPLARGRHRRRVGSLVAEEGLVGCGLEEDLCALLLALGHGLWKMAGSASGCRGVLKVIVAALPVTCARFSSVVVFGLGCLRIVGLLEGQGDIPT